MSKSSAAESLKLSAYSLESLEDGSASASLEQLKAMAKTYKRTLATLLLHEPPKEKPMSRDFRSVNSAQVGHFDEKTIIAVRKARAYASSLLELRKDAGLPTPPFILRAATTDAAEKIAASISASWDLASIQDITDTKIALETYIEKFEERGIAVFQLSLTKDEVRGFALPDEVMPVIAIKRGSETVPGKIFTLFHEFGHLLLGVSAITDGSTYTSSSVEQWCNAFAGAIILPKDALSSHPIVRQYEQRGATDWVKNDLITIGEAFHAGPLATLRALLEMGRTTRAFYDTKHRLWNKPSFGRSKTPEGRNVPKETIAEKGRTYVALAFRAYDRNRIDLKDLSDYLGMKMSYIPKTRQMLGV